MRDRALRSLLTVVGAFLVVVASAPSVSAQESGAPVDLGAYGGAVRFEAGADGVLDIEGDRRYADTVEVRTRRGGGPVFVNELSMQAYVEGLAEVPARWPMEALKAQAVAARTYAWYQTELGTFERRGLGYDICATVACQVFHGRDIVETPVVGQRWAEAVAATEGEVLTYDGGPILARFFSTSGGHTQDNEDVFPREGPRPYLKGVPDPYDEVSPLHEWQVRFPRDRFDAIVSRGETLGAAAPVADVRVRDVPDGEDRLVVVGRDGTEADVGVSAFRFFVSSVAPDLFPDDYPSTRPDGGPLPATLPSSRFEVTVTDAEVVIDGRGWGHGVGMSQYGALGQAEAGIGYGDILASYYQGLRPAPAEGVPSRVRVGLDEDVDAPLVLRSDEPFRVVASGQVITDRGLGTWTVAPRPDGSLGLIAPPGYGAPLIVSPTEATRLRPLTVEVLTVETVVNKPSELALEVRTADGREVLRRELGIVAPGRHAATWDLDTSDGAPVPPGEYRARLVATDEDAVSAGEPAAIVVTAPTLPDEPAPSLLAATSTPTPVEPRPVVLAAVLGLVIGGLVGSVLRVRS